MKREDVYKAIMDECLNYKGNFQTIDALLNYENDYYVAHKNGTYGFSRCPDNYDVLGDTVGLCEKEPDIKCDNMVSERCWREAIESVVDE